MINPAFLLNSEVGGLLAKKNNQRELPTQKTMYYKKFLYLTQRLKRQSTTDMTTLVRRKRVMVEQEKLS